MKCCSVWLVIALACCGCLSRAGASTWQELDAESLGRGGITALARLDRSPGAVLEPGFAIGVDAARLFAGSELEQVAVRVACRGTRGGFAVGLAQLQSPVHRETALACGAQARWGDLRLGAGLDVRCTSFDGYTSSWELSPRLGAGGRFGAGVEVVFGLQALAATAAGEGPQLLLAASLPLGGALSAAIQHERAAGAPARSRLGLAWQRRALQLFVGHDVLTATSGAAAALSWSHLRLVCASTSHPDLGWSEAWSCEWHR